MNGAPIVSGDPIKGTIFFTDMVQENSFWADNGAKPNDVIKSVNGTALTFQNVNTILQDMFSWQPGKDIEVVLNRNGEELIIKTKTTKTFTTGKSIMPIETATDAQIALREAWLKG